MTLDLKDNYMDGGDGPAKQERPANPAPSQARKEEDRVHGLLGIIASAAIAALVCGLVFTAGSSMKSRSTEKNEAYREKMGGAECYPLWKAAEEKLGAMRQEDSKFKEIGAKNLGMKDLDSYLGAKVVHNHEFYSKARAWMNCLERQRQKNVPVAVQPKQIPRTRSTL